MQACHFNRFSLALFIPPCARSILNLTTLSVYRYRKIKMRPESKHVNDLMWLTLDITDPLLK